MTPDDSDFIDNLDERTKYLFTKYKKSIEQNVALKSEFLALFDTTLHFLTKLGINRSEIIV